MLLMNLVVTELAMSVYGIPIDWLGKGQHLIFQLDKFKTFLLTSLNFFLLRSFPPSLASFRGGWDLGAHACLATGFLLTMLGEITMLNSLVLHEKCKLF